MFNGGYHQPSSSKFDYPPETPSKDEPASKEQRALAREKALRAMRSPGSIALFLAAMALLAVAFIGSYLSG